MQLALPITDDQPLFIEIDRRLRAQFGVPGPWFRPNPLSQLVQGMVGGRTQDAVTLEAFKALCQRFHPWERLRDAPVVDVHETIRAVTFAQAKAPYLKAALQMITAKRGTLTLDFLADWPIDDALLWLERLPGVGRKTAALTLNFSTLRMRTLVIDTHHLRVLRRLGLIGARADTRQAYDCAMSSLPMDWSAEELDIHHQLIKRLGQTICRAKNPDCPNCPLSDLCPAAATYLRKPPLMRSI